MAQDKLSATSSAFLRKSAKSTFPLLSHFTTTTFKLTICADAGFVPCAELGIRQILRCPSLRLS